MIYRLTPEACQSFMMMSGYKVLLSDLTPWGKDLCQVKEGGYGWHKSVWFKVSVFSHLGAGWSANSSYSLIGALRSVAQTLSYEISLAFLFLSSAYLVWSMDLTEYGRLQEGVSVLMLIPGIAVLWWVSSVAEANRSPFDFAEGESELVSGFNVEYGGGLFAFMFIAEYASMIFMSALSVVMFLGSSSSVGWLMGVLTLMLIFVWIRVSYPRSRYDKLMYFSWLIILPGSLSAVMSLTGLV